MFFFSCFAPRAGGMPPGVNLPHDGASVHSGPYIFMEQHGPHAVSVNSIEVSATAVPNTAPTPTTTSGQFFSHFSLVVSYLD